MLNFENIEVSEDAQKAINEQVNSLVAQSVEKEVSGLKGKVDELLSEKKQFQQQAEEEKQAALKAAEDAARKSGDVESLDKNWNEKFTKYQSESEEKVVGLESTIRKLTVGQAATKLAAELGGENAEALLPHIAPRLDVDVSTGDLKVKDVTGGLSPLTLDELKAELKETSYLAPLIVASNATGGGATGNKSAAGGSDTNMTADQKRAAEINKRLGR